MHQLGVTKLLWQVIDEQVATLRTGDGASFSECRSIIRTKDVKERRTDERKKERKKPSVVAFGHKQQERNEEEARKERKEKNTK